MIFGNWEVSENGIIGHNNMGNFEIIKEDLRLLLDSSNGKYIDKLINITEKDGITREEVINLNIAYIYALGKFGIEDITEVHIETTRTMQLGILEGSDI